MTVMGGLDASVHQRAANAPVARQLAAGTEAARCLGPPRLCGSPIPEHGAHDVGRRVRSRERISLSTDGAIRMYLFDLGSGEDAMQQVLIELIHTRPEIVLVIFLMCFALLVLLPLMGFASG